VAASVCLDPRVCVWGGGGGGHDVGGLYLSEHANVKHSLDCETGPFIKRVRLVLCCGTKESLMYVCMAVQSKSF
jgi:hypothetical protein